ncbi:MAG: metabolite traffic protein EboE [Phycisphaerales bacterium]|nr:metabolite traffic protein EboE [Phycisphaerales bacterium]
MPPIAYCTNVHAGPTLRETEENLDRFAISVRNHLGGDTPLGIGLWLAASAARELRESGRARAIRDHLDEHGIQVVTINGFPFGDFHADVVKHAVYEPNWADPKRLEYTLDLAELLAELVPEGTTETSISTLPIGWRSEFNKGDGRAEIAAKQLLDCARGLRELEDRSGVLVHVDLEPEPGCLLDTADDVVEFFEHHLHSEGSFDPRRHLQVCHDICHSAVMFEPQTAALRTYREHGIKVGKIQVSSAIEIDFDTIDDPAELDRTLEVYRGFAEPRYLHQTVVRRGDATTFHEDLPIAMSMEEPSGTWRTHFHVPIFTTGTDAWRSTGAEIERCLAAWPANEPLPILEVETYAWEVLPSCMYDGNGLARGIAEEILWMRSLLDRLRPGEGASTP